jgi:sec-independent protein translocase protein TatB
MFEIGFSEIFLIAVVALVVIGPERLPKVARTLGHLMGRLQRYVNDVKSEINREIELEELKKMKSQFEEAAKSAEQSITDTAQDIKNEIEPSLAIHNPAVAEESKSIAATDTSNKSS